MRKIFELDFCIAQILLLISVVIEINQKEYWGSVHNLAVGGGAVCISGDCCPLRLLARGVFRSSV